MADATGPRREAIEALAWQLVQARDQGAQVALVSSGAVACGLSAMGLSRMPRTIVEKQAAAALGQQALMAAYARALAPHGLRPAQVLLTAEDLARREGFLNARHTLDALLRLGAIPIVNENDTVSYEEIRFGDNDRLSALVAQLIDADLLLLLTTVEGLRERGGAGPLIHCVAAGDDVEQHLTQARTPTGVGGMRTKVEAARQAARQGVEAVIAQASLEDALLRVLRGEAVGTRFEPLAPAQSSGQRNGGRRRWLKTAAKAKGVLRVDEGAQRALVERGASLLPSGLVAVEGAFDAGDVVEIALPGKAPFARGLASYAAHEARVLIGRQSSEIEEVLGLCYSEEIVHRDDMVLLVSGDASDAASSLETQP